MKLYTQILLGMLFGVIVGLTLGPRSQLLSADLYTFSRGDQARLYLDEAGEKPLQALSSAPLSLKLISYKKEETAGSEGGEDRPAWAKVSLRLGKAQLVAPAQRAALAEALGRAPQSLKVGEELTLWLKLTYLPLEGGGFVAKEAPISSWGHWLMSLLAPIGAVFMRLLKMVIVPLVFSSLLVGIASLGDIRKLGRLGGRTIGLYLMTTALAVSLGLFCAHLFNPGAQLVEATWGRVDPKRILGTGLFDMGEAEKHPEWLKEARVGEHTPESIEYGISSFTFNSRRPGRDVHLQGRQRHLAQ